MKNILAALALGAVTLLLLTSGSESADAVASPPVYEELVQLTSYTSQLAEHLKAFMAGEKVTDKAIIEKFKAQGDLLAKAEMDLTEQMAALGEFLGIVPPGNRPPPPPMQ